MNQSWVWTKVGYKWTKVGYKIALNCPIFRLLFGSNKTKISLAVNLIIIKKWNRLWLNNIYLDRQIGLWMMNIKTEYIISIMIKPKDSTVTVNMYNKNKFFWLWLAVIQNISSKWLPLPHCKAKSGGLFWLY